MKAQDNPVRYNRQTLACMDSGVGGLAVLKHFIRHMPQSPYTFIGDTAWMPYGEKSLPVVRERVLNVFRWLDHTYPLAAFVLACNTATVAAFDELAALNLPYPILEPVKTTAEWVNATVPPGKRVGIMATPGTVSGERYLQFLDPTREVMQIPCTGLASIIESGICDGPELDEVLLPYLSSLQRWHADVVILGCTHYSFIQDKVQKILGPDVALIDSADVLTKVAIPIIQELDLGSGLQQMLVTGNSNSFAKAISMLPLTDLQSKPVTTIAVTDEFSCQVAPQSA